jgi:CrcB protein
MTWMSLALVALGGALGAVGRYAMSGAVQRWTSSPMPVGTLAVNVIGCVVVGYVVGLSLARPTTMGPGLKLFLVVGVCGGFTTFSAFGYETFELLRSNQLMRAGLSVSAQLLAGLAAVWAGLALARLSY